MGDWAFGAPHALPRFKEHVNADRRRSAGKA